MAKDANLLLDRLLESINLIETYVAGEDQRSFMESFEKRDAVAKRLELIGEIVKRLPDDIKNLSQQVPWKKIAGLRDILTHDYFDVDEELLWEVIIKDLPDLKIKITELKARS